MTPDVYTVPGVSILYAQNLELSPPLFGRHELTQQQRVLGLVAKDLDGVALGQRDDGLLPRTGLAGDIAHALGLGLDRQGVHANDLDAEDLLDSVLDLILVSILGDLERVLVQLHAGEGTLGHDRTDDDLVGGHLCKHLPEVSGDVGGHQHGVVVDEIVGVGLVGSDDERLGNVAERQVGVDVLIANDDGQTLALKAESLEHGDGTQRGRRCRLRCFRHEP